MEIRQIVNSVFNSNSFILSEAGSLNVFLIDIGDFNPIISQLKEDAMIKGVFLTHTHYDHIYGIRELVKAYPDCIVYTSSFGQEALASNKKNFSRYHNDPIVFTNTNLQVLKERDKVHLFPNIELETYETSGHDKRCLTYKIGKSIFSGDSFIPGLKVITSFPYSNKIEASTSVQRIISLANGNDLYPGHGTIYENFSH